MQTLKRLRHKQYQRITPLNMYLTSFKIHYNIYVECTYIYTKEEHYSVINYHILAYLNIISHQLLVYQH